MPAKVQCCVSGRPEPGNPTFVIYKVGRVFFVRTAAGQWQWAFGLDEYEDLTPGIFCGTPACSRRLEQELKAILREARDNMGCLSPERERRDHKLVRDAGLTPPPPVDSASRGELRSRARCRGYKIEALVRARAKATQAEQESLRREVPAAAWPYEEPVFYTPSPEELQRLRWPRP